MTANISTTSNVSTTNPSTTNSSTTNSSNNEKKVSIFAHVILLIFSLISLLIGITIIKKYNTYDTETTAKVIETDCGNFRTKSGISYSCNIKLEYYVKEIQSNKTQIIQTSNVIYSVGDSLVIKYNSSNYSQIILQSDSNKLTGIIFSVIGGLILVVLFLILIGVISPIYVSNVISSSPYYTPYSHRYYQTYLTPEQTFASSFGMAMGSKIANKI